MRVLKTWLLFPVLFAIPLWAQSDNTLYVKNFSGGTVGQMATAAQAACNPSLNCVIVFDPSLANYPAGTLPTPCSICIWEDFRTPGTLNITGNLYVNGALVNQSSSGSGGNGSLPSPLITPSGGTYNSPQTVAINLSAGSIGCYTVDGSTPVASSGTCTHGSTYSAAISVASSETINVLATESGWTNSSIATAVYTINTGSGGNGSLASPTITPTGGAYNSPQTVTISLPAGATGCYTVDGSAPVGSSGTCTHGSTYSAPISVASSETINALATESGWTNSSVATAVYTINAGTYSDNFSRQNGTLGSNWAEAYGSKSGLQIISDQVYASQTPADHAFDVYTGGSFSNNQWTSFVLGNGPGTHPSSQGAIVRGSSTNANWYNDAVSVGGPFLNLGNSASYDFCLVGGVANYASGDTHELDVAGAGPVFFWSKHNGTLDATCVDTAFGYTSGQPGLGVLEANSTPTVSASNWQGGSLPNFSTTPSDTFNRANAGWLGVNWWFKEPGGAGSSAGAFFILQNNAAVISRPNNYGIGIWTTPFNVNHSSWISIGNLASGDFVGPVARYNLPVAQNPTSDSFYMVFGSNSGLTLYAYNQGNWAALQSYGSYPSSITSMELDATGTNPVVLTLKINGAQFGSSYSDSTYKLTGLYSGFGIIAGSTQNTAVTGWQGANM